MSSRNKHDRTQHTSRAARCYFLKDLPIELRRHVYSYVDFQSSTAISVGPVLVKTEPTPQGNMAIETPAFTAGARDVTALLCTNKQIHEEAAPYFFASNVFWFSSAIWTARWFKLIGTRAVDSIRHIIIVAPCERDGIRSWAPVLRHFAKAKNLRVVSFQMVDHDRLEHPDAYQRFTIQNLGIVARDIIATALAAQDTCPVKDRLLLDPEHYSGLREYTEEDTERWENGEEDLGGEPYDEYAFELFEGIIFNKFTKLGLSPRKTIEDFRAAMVPYEQGLQFPPLHPACMERWKLS